MRNRYRLGRRSIPETCGWWARTFIGKAERKLANPEWTSPDTDRHQALDFGSSGKSERSTDSCRYSPIAKVSQIHQFIVPQLGHQEGRGQE